MSVFKISGNLAVWLTDFKKYIFFISICPECVKASGLSRYKHGGLSCDRPQKAQRACRQLSNTFPGTLITVNTSRLKQHMGYQGQADWQRWVYANVFPWSLSTNTDRGGKRERWRGKKKERGRARSYITSILMSKWTDYHVHVVVIMHTMSTEERHNNLPCDFAIIWRQNYFSSLLLFCFLFALLPLLVLAPKKSSMM